MKRYLFGLLVLLLTGCTSPLWWHNPEHSFLYRGVHGIIADQSTVMQHCGFLSSGCLEIERKEGSDRTTTILWTVNNPISLRHECSHIDGLWTSKIAGLSGDQAIAKEQNSDFIFNSIFGLHFVGVTLTSLFPAGNGGCGNGTMVVWNKDVPTILTHYWYDKEINRHWYILYTRDEVNRGAPIYPPKEN